MGIAYRCDRCGAYFDDVSSIIHESAVRTTGVQMAIGTKNRYGLIDTNTHHRTTLCPTCSVEFGRLLMKFLRQEDDST